MAVVNLCYVMLPTTGTATSSTPFFSRVVRHLPHPLPLPPLPTLTPPFLTYIRHPYTSIPERLSGTRLVSFPTHTVAAERYKRAEREGEEPDLPSDDEKKSDD